MEIQYLKSLEHFDTIDGLKNEGVSEVEIEQAEHKFNINFPKAYKEFLLLAGELNNGLFGNGVSSSLDWAVEDFQQDAAEELARKNVSIPKPFWVFASMDGCEQFDFFYLGEGDDPRVYSWSIYDADTQIEEGQPKGVKKSRYTFSQYVETVISAHKKGIM